MVDINPVMTDHEIWEYAIKHNLVILTKDTDFYYRFLLEDRCPKVVFFQLGNMTLKAMYKYFSNYWPEIIDRIHSSSLIVASHTKIKVVF